MYSAVIPARIARTYQDCFPTKCFVLLSGNQRLPVSGESGRSSRQNGLDARERRDDLARAGGWFGASRAFLIPSWTVGFKRPAFQQLALLYAGAGKPRLMPQQVQGIAFQDGQIEALRLGLRKVSDAH